MVEFLQYSFCFMVVISLAMRHMGSSLPNQGLKPYTTTHPLPHQHYKVKS